MSLAEVLTLDAARGERREPEGITVKVLTQDESQARSIAVLMIPRLYDRRPGAVLHAEQDLDGLWLVTVEDRGTRWPH